MTRRLLVALAAVAALLAAAATGATATTDPGMTHDGVELTHD